MNHKAHASGNNGSGPPERRSANARSPPGEQAHRTNAPQPDSYTTTATVAPPEVATNQHCNPPASPRDLLEPVARKRARPVLSGPRRSNAPGLPDERWFRELTDKALRRGVFGSVPELITRIEEYLTAHNAKGSTFVWTATADQILAKVARGRVALEKSVNSETHH